VVEKGDPGAFSELAQMSDLGRPPADIEKRQIGEARRPWLPTADLGNSREARLDLRELFLQVSGSLVDFRTSAALGDKSRATRLELAFEALTAVLGRTETSFKIRSERPSFG
jgi:hypothetical protein